MPGNLPSPSSSPRKRRPGWPSVSTWQPGDLVFFVADQPKVTNEALGHLRNHLGKRLDLIDDNRFNFVWVTHFPMFEYDEVEKRYQALHHPFTAPIEERLRPPGNRPSGRSLPGLRPGA
jgi:aspartyl-tRNA synthetase